VLESNYVYESVIHFIGSVKFSRGGSWLGLAWSSAHRRQGAPHTGELEIQEVQEVHEVQEVQEIYLGY
jgi:hypothetical protein